MSSNPTNLISNLSKALEGGAKQYIEKRTKIHPAVSWPYDPILGLAGRRPVWPCEDDDGDDDGGDDGDDDGGDDGDDDDDDDGDDDEDDEDDVETMMMEVMMEMMITGSPSATNT